MQLFVWDILSILFTQAGHLYKLLIRLKDMTIIERSPNDNYLIPYIDL